MTASTPAACSATRSFRARSTMLSMPAAASWSGAPGKGSRWTMAMTGLVSPKMRSNLVCVTMGYSSCASAIDDLLELGVVVGEQRLRGTVRHENVDALDI